MATTTLTHICMHLDGGRDKTKTVVRRSQIQLSRQRITQMQKKQKIVHTRIWALRNDHEVDIMKNKPNLTDRYVYSILSLWHNRHIGMACTTHQPVWHIFPIAHLLSVCIGYCHSRSPNQFLPWAASKIDFCTQSRDMVMDFFLLLLLQCREKRITFLSPPIHLHACETKRSYSIENAEYVRKKHQQKRV